MKRIKVIVIIAPDIEVWSNFKKMCEAKKLPYHSLSRLNFPIVYKEYIIDKKDYL